MMADGHRLSELAPESRTTEARDSGRRVAIEAMRKGCRVILCEDGEFKSLAEFDRVH